MFEFSRTWLLRKCLTHFFGVARLPECTTATFFFTQQLGTLPQGSPRLHMVPSHRHGCMIIQHNTLLLWNQSTDSISCKPNHTKPSKILRMAYPEYLWNLVNIKCRWFIDTSLFSDDFAKKNRFGRIHSWFSRNSRGPKIIKLYCILKHVYLVRCTFLVDLVPKSLQNALKCDSVALKF